MSNLKLRLAKVEKKSRKPMSIQDLIAMYYYEQPNLADEPGPPNGMATSGSHSGKRFVL